MASSSNMKSDSTVSLASMKEWIDAPYREYSIACSLLYSLKPIVELV